jgi:hypothetical protein
MEKPAKIERFPTFKSEEKSQCDDIMTLQKSIATIPFCLFLHSSSESVGSSNYRGRMFLENGANNDKKLKRVSYLYTDVVETRKIQMNENKEIEKHVIEEERK